MQRRKRRGVRASLVIALGLMMFSSTAIFIPEDAKAAITYYETTAPSSFNSTYWKVMPKYVSTPTSCYAIQVDIDGYQQDLYTTGSTTYIETNDFTNPTWFPHAGNPFRTSTGAMPPDNDTATIDYVFIFLGSYWTSVTTPEYYYSFSIDDKATWHQSTLYTYENQINAWDVTDVITWNATILNSPDLWVRMQCNWDSPIHFYVRYLGFLIGWNVPWGAEGTSEGEDPSETSDPYWSYDLTGNGLIGIMGIVGLGGLIATPAWAVLSFRNSDDGRIVTFIKALAMGTFCLTLFLASFLA